MAVNEASGQPGGCPDYILHALDPSERTEGRPTNLHDLDNETLERVVTRALLVRVHDWSPEARRELRAGIEGIIDRFPTRRSGIDWLVCDPEDPPLLRVIEPGGVEAMSERADEHLKLAGMLGE